MLGSFLRATSSTITEVITGAVCHARSRLTSCQIMRPPLGLPPTSSMNEFFQWHTFAADSVGADGGRDFECHLGRRAAVNRVPVLEHRPDAQTSRARRSSARLRPRRYAAPAPRKRLRAVRRDASSRLHASPHPAGLRARPTARRRSCGGKKRGSPYLRDSAIGWRFPGIRGAPPDPDRPRARPTAGVRGGGRPRRGAPTCRA